MKAEQVIRLIVHIARAAQIPTALVALGLTSSLLPTFSQLSSACTPLETSGIECARLSQTLGGLCFALATTILALIDCAVGWLALCKPTLLPVWISITLDSVTAGFYLGSGSTIAARLNGELCDAGPRDERYACGRLFANMGIMFAGAMVAYALVACFWTLRGRRCRHFDGEVEGAEGHAGHEVESEGHVLENPFRDPSEATSESERRDGAISDGAGKGELRTRKSWSERM